MNIKIFDLNNPDGLTPAAAANDSYFGLTRQMFIINPTLDAIYSYAAILPTGRVISIHFKEGVDWTHMFIVPSYYATPEDKTTVLRFNYTDQRELYEIKKMVAGNITGTFQQALTLDKLIVSATGMPNSDANGCVFGDWFHDS